MAKKIILLLLLLSFLSCQSKKNQEIKSTAKLMGYGKDEVVFIINADDVGMDKDSDKAVFDLYNLGKLQTFSMMVPTNNFENAAKYVIENKIPVGVHLTLTNEWQEKNGWHPILSKEKVPSLYNKNGYMWSSVDDVAKNVKVGEAKLELEAQIEKALEMGLDVTHLDFHMLFWGASDEMQMMAFNLGKKYKLPIVTQVYWENTENQKKIVEKLCALGIYSADRFWMYYNPDIRKTDKNASKVDYTRMFENAKPGVHHVAIHPSLLTENIKNTMADADFRFDEFNIWKSSELDKVIKNKNIKFTNYRKLRDIAKNNK